MGGAGVSKSQVSRLCADIDERVQAFLERRIEGRWPCLWLDATHLKVREDGVRACPRTGGGHALTVSRAVMVAVAVNEDGRRKVLGIATGPSEAEVFWTGFLRGLADRSLRRVKLVVADDHKGPRAAAGRVAGRDVAEMPRPLGQERAVPCRRQAPWGGLRDAQDDLRPRQSKAAAVKQWGEVADALRARHPKLGELMDASREDVLAYMDFPREHWPQIASTNPLERLNREVKRRSDVVGIFPNDAAVVRLVGALMLEASDEWAVTRRYMSLEALARVVQTDPVSLPTAAA